MSAKLVILVALGCLGTLVQAGRRTPDRMYNAHQRDVDLGVVLDYVCPENEHFAPHPDDCTLYYSCWNNVTHLWKCSSDLVYDLTYDGCNFLELTDCGSRVPPFTCPANNPNGLFPLQPAACQSKYFKCVNGVHTVEVCPNGEIFDANTGACSNTIVCAGTTTPRIPTAPGGQEFVCPNTEGTYPSPFACTQFYICQGGYPYLFECPSDLYYNPATNACDNPASVPCTVTPSYRLMF